MFKKQTCNKAIRNTAICLTSVALAISGCATTKRNASGVMETSGGCNAAAMAIGGAILGALIGGKNNRNEGALIGGAIGGLSCLAWNYKVEQTKTAEQVNNAYKAANNGVLPSSAKVIGYSITPLPSSTISAGNPIVIGSTIAVVDGANKASTPIVEEELQVFHEGKAITTARKRANEGSGAGEYSTKFQLDLPKGVPQGSYPVKTALYLNGQRVESRSLDMQLVITETGILLATAQ